jgi:phosphotransferase system  glucose/maltose/N-acetylglucosamine-specific IIC component
MKLSVKGLILATAIAWALCMLVVGILNLIWPGYGGEFLRVMASVYPGYKASGTFIDVIVGMLYALVDGAICGFVFALLYNAFVGKAPKRKRR